jgi:hypothetical protein
VDGKFYHLHPKLFENNMATQSNVKNLSQIKGAFCLQLYQTKPEGVPDQGLVYLKMFLFAVYILKSLLSDLGKNPVKTLQKTCH